MMFATISYGACAYGAYDDNPMSSETTLDELLANQSTKPLEPQLNHLNTDELSISFSIAHLALGNIHQGAHQIERSQLLDLGYSDAPKSLSIDQYTLDIYYGINQWLTAQLKTSVQDRQLESLNTSQSNRGITDTQVIGHIMLYRDNRFSNQHSFIVSAGLSLPSGSISDNEQPQPFLLELGSGSTDGIIGLSYSNASEDWSWGTQVMAYIPHDYNSAGYQRGSQYSYQAWFNIMPTDNLLIATSVKATRYNATQGSHHGYQHLATNTSPVYDPRNNVTRSVDLGLSAQYRLPTVNNQQIILTTSLPLSQQVTGISLIQEWQIALGWQVVF